MPCACLAGVLVHALIPIHIMYYYAWPLMILGVAAVQLVFLRLFALVITLPLIGSAAWSAPATSAPAPPVSSLFSSFWTLLYPGDGGRSVSSLLQHLCESGTLAPSGLSFCARTIASPSSLRFPVIFMLFCLSVLHGDIYAHFVLKIIIMYSMVGISCVLLAVPFVQALRAHHFSRAGLGRWT